MKTPLVAAGDIVVKGMQGGQFKIMKRTTHGWAHLRFTGDNEGDALKKACAIAHGHRVFVYRIIDTDMFDIHGG